MPLTSSAVKLKGYVFVDKNRNGIKDNGDSGVKDAVVSDQVVTALTNSDGYYEFESNQNLGFVVLIQPSAFKIKGSFWKEIPDNQQEFEHNFQVIPLPQTKTFTFIHASDPHLSAASLEQFQKFKHKVDSIIPAFVLMTGDLIKDALRVNEEEATTLYKLYADEIKKFNMPVYSIPGNHEIFGIERHTSGVEKTHPLYGKKMYRHYLGPDYYAFNYGGVHFIGINSVDFLDLWYYGHVDSLQLQWLSKDISLLKKSTPIVTFNHIPFYTGGISLWGFQESEPGSTLIDINGKKIFRHAVDNAPEVMKQLSNNAYPLALSGHYHASQQFTFDSSKQKTRFHQTGALVGHGKMSDMTMPSGFTLYTVVNGIINNGEFIELK
jgi:predicted MPP superfamily phosphohydrolase